MSLLILMKNFSLSFWFKGQVAVKTEMNEEIKLIPNQKLEMNDHKNKVVPVDVYDYHFMERWNSSV